MPRQSRETKAEKEVFRAELARRLRAAIDGRQPRLSLRELAGKSGLQQPALTFVLQGKRALPGPKLRRLADVLGVPLEQLVPGSTESAVRKIPVLGRIAATRLRVADAERAGELELARLVPSGEVFALRVRGDSMSGAGILDGDLVVFRQTSTARPEDIVAATVVGQGGVEETTLKRLRRQDGALWLVPENAHHQPVQLRPGETWIHGVAVLVLRQYEVPVGG